MTEQVRSTRLRKMILVALFSAIMWALYLAGIGIIPIGPANVTVLHIPVIIGTLVCGLPGGLILGLFFGITSVITAFTKTSALVAPMLAQSPVLVVVMSIVPRLLIPVVTWAVARLYRNRTLSLGVSSVCGSLTNTIFYLGFMLAFYWILGIENATLLGVIGGVALTNGIAEAIASAILTVPVCLTLDRFARPTKKQLSEE
ncbi:MAG: ECF transporter S component [Christensenellales bacterium]|jgi:uncharacterized membrane protein